MKNYCTIRTILALGSLFIFPYFGSKPSSEKKELPNIIITGKVVADNESYDARYLSIAGEYQHIALYKEPSRGQQDPTQNITFIDLYEISKIRPSNIEPEHQILFFKNRPYVKITVTFKDNREESFIIEQSRRLLFQVTTPSETIEKEIAFNALSSVEITDFNRSSESLSEKTRKSLQKKECDEARAQLSELEKQTMRIAPQQRAAIQENIAQVKHTVKKVCDE